MTNIGNTNLHKTKLLYIYKRRPNTATGYCTLMHSLLIRCVSADSKSRIQLNKP